MKTATKGNEAEAMILAALIERGYDVSVPFGSGQPYDLVIDLGGFDLLKVQCKTGWWDKNCVSVGGFRGYLRLEPARNNQQRKVRFAADFQIDRWSVEQLLEVKRSAEVLAEPELNFA